jgi:hypothetical protein
VNGLGAIEVVHEKVQDKNGDTSFYLVCYRDHLEVVNRLVATKVVDRIATNKKEETLLY